MARLKAHEKVVFERLFDRDGYVLNFSNQTFAEFFREYGIDIEGQKYQFNGTSKMKRLRAFWEIEPDNVVGTVLNGLLEYACVVNDVDSKDRASAVNIISRLNGKATSPVESYDNEHEFLGQKFSAIDWTRLNVDI